MRWGDTAQTAPLEVLAEILGGGTTSRLYRALVVEKALAVSAGAGYSPGGIGPQTVSVYLSPRAGVDLATREAAVDAELGALWSWGGRCVGKEGVRTSGSRWVR